MGETEILHTHNLLFWEFAAVCRNSVRNVQIFAPLTFLTCDVTASSCHDVNTLSNKGL